MQPGMHTGKQVGTLAGKQTYIQAGKDNPTYIQVGITASIQRHIQAGRQADRPAGR